MKKKITRFIADFVKDKDEGGLIPHIWREPLVYFGDANHPELPRLREVAHKDHILPVEVLSDAKTIVAFFLPFTEAIGNSNKGGRISSKEWAMAYEKTNAAIGELCTALIGFLEGQGVKAAVCADAYSYDEELLMSKWSQRHIAYFCGMGTFGLNNMLITEAGCCGRIGTVLIDLDMEHDEPLTEENCLFKRNGTCGTCVKHCPFGALTKEGYSREHCNELCAENATVHNAYCPGGSYALASGFTGTNTCGKCLAGLPCTFRKPK